jgi:hypothetical protein
MMSFKRSKVLSEEEKDRKNKNMKNSLWKTNWISVTRNQGERDALVIGETEDEVLVAYAMPDVYKVPQRVLKSNYLARGWKCGRAIYLNQIKKDGKMFREESDSWGDKEVNTIVNYPEYKAVSHKNPPKKWEKAIKDAKNFGEDFDDGVYSGLNIFHPEFWLEYYHVPFPADYDNV